MNIVTLKILDTQVHPENPSRSEKKERWKKDILKVSSTSIGGRCKRDFQTHVKLDR
jgi:hypothetical protein